MLINYETTKQAPQLDPEFSIKLPIMDNNSVGVGKPDGTTITANEDGTMTASGGGSGAANDYATATNKPQINSVELVGNKTLDQLGIQAKGNYATTEQLATKADSSQLANYATTEQLANYLTTATASSTYATKTELSAKADTTALPAANTLMTGTAPTVADIDAGSVTELSAFIPLFNTILQQLRDRGVITQ